MRRALTIAAIAHAAVIGSVAMTRVRVPVPPVVVATEAPPVDVDLDVAPPPPPRTPAPAMTPGAAPTPASGPAAARLSSVPVAVPVPVPGAGEAPSSPVEPSPTPNLSLEALGLAGPNRFLTATPAPIRDTEARTPNGATAALRAPGDARATELGLGPDGPVRTALGDATSASLAPTKGRATFRVIADARGKVVDVELLDTDGGRAGWADAAALAKRALLAQQLRMPSYAKGAEMTFEVTSASKLPSGHAPGTQVHVLGQRVKKGEDDTSTDVRLLEPPRVELVDVGAGLKIPVPVVGIGLVGVAGDPADIGATARRVVHTRLLSTRYL